MNYIALNAVTILIAACAGLVVGVGYEALPVRHSQQMRGFPIGLLATAFIAEYWLAAILAGP